MIFKILNVSDEFYIAMMIPNEKEEKTRAYFDSLSGDAFLYEIADYLIENKINAVAFVNIQISSNRKMEMEFDLEFFNDTLKANGCYIPKEEYISRYIEKYPESREKILRF